MCISSRFEKEVDFLDSHNDAGVVGSNLWFVDSDGKKIQEIRLPVDPSQNTMVSSVF